MGSGPGHIGARRSGHDAHSLILAVGACCECRDQLIDSHNTPARQSLEKRVAAETQASRQLFVANNGRRSEHGEEHATASAELVRRQEDGGPGDDGRSTVHGQRQPDALRDRVLRLDGHLHLRDGSHRLQFSTTGELLELPTHSCNIA